MREMICAVHSSEVDRFFRRIGLHAALLAGEIACCVCGEPLSAGTFKSVLRKNGELLFFCERPKCEPDEMAQSQAGLSPATATKVG